MSYLEDRRDAQNTRDNLGAPDTNQVFVMQRSQEDVFITELSTLLRQRSIGTAFILGHSANGLLGTSRLGAGTYGDLSIVRVINPNKTFREYFRDSQFKDSNSTANWDTTNFKIKFNQGQEAITSSIYLNNTEVTQVVLANTVQELSSNQVLLNENTGGQEVNM